MLKHSKLRKRQTSGFTLIELAVTLAIAGVLMYYAIPAYSDFSQRQTMTNETNDLLSDLGFARSLAIENGSRVTVSSVSGDTDWSDGWDIRETLANGNLSLIRSKIEVPGNVTVTGSVATVTYDGLGYLLNPVTINFDIEINPDFPNFLAINILPSGLASSNRDSYAN